MTILSKDLEDLFIPAVVLIMAILLTAIIVRVIFNIPIIVKHTKAQTMILLKIAEKNNVSEQEIEGILDVIEKDVSNMVEGADKRFRNRYKSLK